MRILKSFFWLSLMLSFAGQILSAELPVKIVLNKIEAISITEKKEEDLYFMVSEGKLLPDDFTYQIPAYPFIWNSTKLNVIKNIVLWQGNIREGDTRSLNLRLMDADLSSDDEKEMGDLVRDDYIDSVEVTLTNKEGKLYGNLQKPPLKEAFNNEKQNYTKELDFSDKSRKYKLEMSIITE